MTSTYPMLAAHQPPPPSSRGDDLLRSSTNSASKYERGSSYQSDTTYSAKTPLEVAPRDVSRSHRTLVFTDPVAFRYLEEDDSTTVLARRTRLEGYELYVVEQWACSRMHPTFTVCTYTGDASRSILVNILAIPEDPNLWSKRLQIYLDAISQSYARERETRLGLIMVTNLSSFPSSLNVIAVPDGDVKKHREDFIVNENLKRMGCTGRAAMVLQFPVQSTISKFHHTFKTSEKTPLYSSVMELVRFCQIALVLSGKLQPVYADGLLCDITEKAISDWWNEIGIDFHNIEPSDGVFGPTTVAALIGLMIGAYNRLKETGAPVGKDPVDLSSMKRAVEHFQKANKMDRTRRLDRATLDRLHRVTAKSAEDEGLAVTRALKSTVAGLGGKGGEMLARGFGAKERTSIAEVETLDIVRLSQLVIGKSMKWLWQGKELKSTGAMLAGPSDELHGMVFSTDQEGNYIWTGEARERPSDFDFLLNAPDPEGKEKRSHRLRNAVNMNGRVHHTGHADQNEDRATSGGSLIIPNTPWDMKEQSRSREGSEDRHRGMPPLNLALANAPANLPKAEVFRRGTDKTQTTNATQSPVDPSHHRQALRGLDHIDRVSPASRRAQEDLAKIREALKARRYQSFSAGVNFKQPRVKALRRSLSAVQLRGVTEARRHRLPRQLSFSIASEALELQADDSSDAASDAEKALNPAAVMKVRKEQLRKSQYVASKMFQIERGLAPFALSHVENVENIKQATLSTLEDLNSIYYQHLEEYQTMQATSTDLVAREKMSLNEGMRSIEMMGQKLDYELDSLQSRMQEVEEGVDDFERRIMDIEASVKLLVAEPHKEEDRRPWWWERMLGSKLFRSSSTATATNTEEALQQEDMESKLEQDTGQ